MKIDLSLSVVRRKDVGYFLKVALDGVFKYIPLSHDYMLSHPDWITFNTCHDFVSLQRDSLSYHVDSLNYVTFSLPTSCGYISRTGKWLNVGNFHRFVILRLDDFRRSLYII